MLLNGIAGLMKGCRLRPGGQKKNFSLLRGFTLVEVLLVVSLSTMLGVGIFQTVSNGLKVWQRSKELGVEDDIYIFLEKLSLELRNSFNFSLFEFEGQPQHMTFNTLVDAQEDRLKTGNKEVFVKQIGRVQYRYNHLKSCIMRRQAHYGQAVNEVYAPEAALACPVDDLQFFYYGVDMAKLSPQTMKEGQLPLAVEIEVTYKKRLGYQEKIKRFVRIPRAYMN